MPHPTDLTPGADERLDVVDALYRFAAGQDLRDPDLFASAFADEAALDFVQPAARLGVTIPVFQGKAAIVDTVMTNTAPLVTTHTVTNPRVRLDGDRAELTALVEAQHVPRADPSRHLMLKNLYRVRLRRDGGAWRIVHLRIDNAWMDGDAAVLFAAAG